MKVLLRESIKRLGRIGDVVDVADGYARNFLIPRGIAVGETADNLARMAKEKDSLVAAETARRGERLAVAERLRKLTVAIPMAASEDGRLYGSVTAAVIAEAIGRSGLEIEPRSILLDRPIKDLGEHSVRVRLHADVELDLPFFVIQPGAPLNPVEDEGGEAAATAEKRLAASAEAESRREAAG